MTTFLERFASSGNGIAVAIKDLIDVEGSVTTAGTRALADAPPAPRDAACLTEIRRREAAGEVWLVGKTNLHELAYGTTGINPWFGTPTNPLDAALIPGGSSSGSAVAVATGDADVALGSDTGGSVRIPAACCGVAGLKTTWGRVPLSGVWPLAPSLDTVGPLARDVAGLVTGMQLLERGFSVPASAAGDLEVARLRALGVEVDPAVDEAIHRALAAAGFVVRDVVLDGWREAWSAADVILSAEAWRADGQLLASRPDDIGEVTANRIAASARVTVDEEHAARQVQLAWQRRLEDVFVETPLLALPTMATLPPTIASDPVGLNRLTLPINLTGLPALSVPVPTAGVVPASLQLVAPAYGDELLLSAGAVVEAAVR
ncbi:MAG: amidase [Frankiaceae bacterium]|jgi:amidase|nr:amidase [Frankiaceae bacterium]